MGEDERSALEHYGSGRRRDSFFRRRDELRHLGAALGAGALHHRAAVGGHRFLRVLHLAFGFAFHAVGGGGVRGSGGTSGSSGHSRQRF